MFLVYKLSERCLFVLYYRSFDFWLQILAIRKYKKNQTKIKVKIGNETRVRTKR